MNDYDVAHINQQGQDIIIIFLNSEYGFRTEVEKNQVRNSLQRCATAAGLAGEVVTVWDAGSGRMGFLAPSEWQSFFASLSLPILAQNINTTLTCS